MENARRYSPVLDTIAWGAFFILWGITEMFESLPDGTGAIGVGTILVGLNVVRSWRGQPVSGFTTTLGVLALLLGALEMSQSLLHLSIELPIFAILLLAFGVILLGRALLQGRDAG